MASVSLADNSPNKGQGSVSNNPDAPSPQQRVERSPKYDFGLGKRRYIITQGGPGKKRLPHYNFGLGKRSNPDLVNYDDTEFYSDANNYDKPVLNMENWENGGYMDNKNDIDVIDYDLFPYPREYKRSAGPYGKRRSYDFGLGKRKVQDEYEKRLHNRYNFGLGRR